jgi:sarcosine oxidase
MRRVDCLVIGGGIAGSAAAWWLSRLGHEVVLLEQFEVGHARGSSHGSVRIFRYAYPAADYVRLAREALPLWRLAEEESGETLVDLTGGIDFGDETALRRLAATLEAEGVPYEMLSQADASARFGGFRFEGPVLFQAEGGRCHAARSVATFQRMASTRGAELRFSEPVLSVRREGASVAVSTAAEEYVADHCIVAAGAWVERLVGGAFRLPALAVTREQPAFFQPREGFEWPSFINHGGAGAFAAYGLLSPGEGLKVGVHMGGAAVDPDTIGVIDPAALAEARRIAEGLLPGVDPEPLKGEACLYTTTPNEDFIIERDGPLVVASPCSGHGFKFGPAIGRLVAEFALGLGDVPGRFRLDA